MSLPMTSLSTGLKIDCIYLGKNDYEKVKKVIHTFTK